MGQPGRRVILQHLSQAIDDLIHRRHPRITGHQSGPIIPDGAELLPAADQLRASHRPSWWVETPKTGGLAVRQFGNPNFRVARLSF